MIPEVGHFALLLALAMAVVQGILPLVGAATGRPPLMNVGRSAAQGQFVFLAMAFAALAWSFLADDFSVRYVAANSNSALPTAYKFAAVWGSHEGSLLLWAFMLGLWTIAVTAFSSRLPEDMVARVLGVLGLVSAGFLSFLLLTSNPFIRLLPGAAEGRDLNPLLQDPGMVIHPPLLYMGYVGFSVAFAFALAALISGRLDTAWARWSRPWTLAAWTFLTLGIAIGSGWAYYELGWGGWWFWDPVENASFMPWLVGTGLIHSLSVTEKRGSFRSWTVLIAIAAFSLSLLGTFLVRSGVLTSVHAFATDPARGIFILALLILVIGGSLALYAWRAPTIGLGGGFELVSRESLLLTNNVLLAVAAGAVLLGTLYPLFLDALGLGKISVGPPYFESVFVPLMVPVLLLLGVGPLARWKHHDLASLVAPLRLPLAATLAGAGAVVFVSPRPSSGQALGVALALWIVATTLLALIQRLRHGDSSLIRRFAAIPAAVWGMTLAHAGVAVFVAGVTLVKSLETNTDMKMQLGDTATLERYTYRFMGIEEREGPNYVAARAHFDVSRDGEAIALLEPEKRLYRAQGMPMTEAAIHHRLDGDLYLSLGEPLAADTWIVQIYHKPFVGWIWGGCLMMALGGAMAAADRRYRRLAQRAAEAAAQGPEVSPQPHAVRRGGRRAGAQA